MEYVQEGVTTLHDFGAAAPEAPVDRATVVVPMTGREHATLAAERVLEALSAVGPAGVLVPLRAEADRVGQVVDWLAGFDLPLSVLWCDGPELGSLLAGAGLDRDGGGDRTGGGKGRDVWLALGLAARSEYVVVHDVDAKSYDERVVPKLLFPLTAAHQFSKGYYARVENDRLYGRLFRLLYRPLVGALAREVDAPVVEFLGAFRYALAGEFATTGEVARRLRVQPGWGLEVGTLSEVYRLVGPAGCAQVDLGVHEHDHRAVTGPRGLSEMSEQVARAVLRAVEDDGAAPDYDALASRYRTEAERLVDAYALDAAFNGLAYDRADECGQVDAYAEAVAPPGPDDRLPAWTEAAVTPAEVCAAAAADLSAISATAETVAPTRG